MSNQSGSDVPTRPPRRLIPVREVAYKIGRGRTWIYNQMAAGTFPRPLPLGAGKHLWEESTIDEWLDRFVAEAGKRTPAAGKARVKAALAARGVKA